MREQDCIDLLRRAGCSEGVIAHCRAVRDLALTYVSDSTVDPDHVAPGPWGGPAPFSTISAGA